MDLTVLDLADCSAYLSQTACHTLIPVICNSNRCLIWYWPSHHCKLLFSNFCNLGWPKVTKYKAFLKGSVHLKGSHMLHCSRGLYRCVWRSLPCLCQPIAWATACSRGYVMNTYSTWLINRVAKMIIVLCVVSLSLPSCRVTHFMKWQIKILTS